MKRILVSIVALFALCLTSLSAQAQGSLDGVDWREMNLDYSSLTADNHPRLFLTDADINGIKKNLGKNPQLASLSKILFEIADGLVDNSEPLEYKFDKAGRSILKVSNEALRRIVALSYAYRMTRNKVYLHKVQECIEQVCSFPDWHPQHFLDPSEMAFGVAIAYDWLYRDLPKETLNLAADRLRRFAMEEVAHGLGEQIFLRSGNWNQVCIASMTAASIATYELNPELSSEIIRRGIQNNFRAVKEIYSPSGAFPEGPGYWEYGTCYQSYLNIMLEDAFGSDFGLSDIEGFSRTGLYKAFTRSGAGHIFNYSDNSDRLTPSPGLWYQAWKFGQTGILYDELKLLEQKSGYIAERRTLLALVSSYRLGKVNPQPRNDRLFIGTGTNDILMAKDGWDEQGAYLGLKGGSASIGHSHMDAGSFVFDAYGSRWVNDYYVRAYEDQEIIQRKLGLTKAQWGYDQQSWRWHLFQYNNRQHSTLTVNGKDHNVEGFAHIVDSWDTPERLGGKLDLSPVFEGDLKSASREASIVNSNALEVIDCLQSPDDTCALVRFTIISKFKPKFTPEGILFSDGKTTMLLSTDAPGAEFKQWSSNPKDYDSPTAFGEPAFKQTWICGYEYTIPAGMSVKVTTTMNKK